MKLFICSETHNINKLQSGDINEQYKNIVSFYKSYVSKFLSLKLGKK